MKYFGIFKEPLTFFTSDFHLLIVWWHAKWEATVSLGVFLSQYCHLKLLFLGNTLSSQKQQHRPTNQKALNPFFLLMETGHLPMLQHTWPWPSPYTIRFTASFEHSHSRQNCFPFKQRFITTQPTFAGIPVLVTSDCSIELIWRSCAQRSRYNIAVFEHALHFIIDNFNFSDRIFGQNPIGLVLSKSKSCSLKLIFEDLFANKDG